MSTDEDAHYRALWNAKPTLRPPDRRPSNRGGDAQTPPRPHDSRRRPCERTLIPSSRARPLGPPASRSSPRRGLSTCSASVGSAFSLLRLSWLLRYRIRRPAAIPFIAMLLKIFSQIPIILDRLDHGSDSRQRDAGEHSELDEVST